MLTTNADRTTRLSQHTLTVQHHATCMLVTSNTSYSPAFCLPVP